MLVRHELMFAAGTIHRRRKYDMARAQGAVGFLIAGPLPGHVVAGSSGRAGRRRAFRRSASRPRRRRGCARRRGGWPTATLTIETEEATGRDRDAAVTISRHRPTNGSCSAPMSTATTSPRAPWTTAAGSPSVLAVTRALAPQVAGFRRGLRRDVLQRRGMGAHRLGAICRGLSAGRARQDRAQRQSRLGRAAVPTSRRSAAAMRGVEPFLLRRRRGQRPSRAHRAAADDQLRPRQLRPAGIPALRLVAGFDDPAAHLRVVLTPADTRDKVAPGRTAHRRRFSPPPWSPPPATPIPPRRRSGAAASRGRGSPPGALAGFPSRSRPISTRRLAPANASSSSA